MKALGYRADFADAVGFHSEKLTVRIACACLAVSPGFHGENYHDAPVEYLGEPEGTKKLGTESVPRHGYPKALFSVFSQ